MKLVTDHGLYRKTTTVEYTPTLDELYWYYKGTATAIPNPNNPYRTNKQLVSKTVYTPELGRGKK